MALKKIILSIILILPFVVQAQTTYLLPGMKDEWLLNRMAIRHSSEHLRYSSIKPFNRRDAVIDIQKIDSVVAKISSVDRYNIESFLMSNAEWSVPRSSFQSNKPILKHFYRTKANAFELKQSGFHLIFNPIIQYQQYKENNNDENVFLNSRGLQVRGLIENKIGFSFYFTENQERPPLHVSDWINKFEAVPGMGYYKSFKNSTTAFDYFETRASVSWKVAKLIDMQIGYDKNFIGNGYRSLFLSDFSNNYMHLKLNTRFGKFHYQNIFAELYPRYVRSIGDRVYPRKYFRAHYLNFAATKWLNLGLFEGTMLGKNNGIPLGLFNPIIFLQLPNKKNQVQDRNYIGFDIKANLFNRFQVYGQLMIDKLKTDGLSNKTWDNRFGYQAGLKYIDAFGLNNVDVQVETNRVRPYTYAANEELTSYVHYNQPLAHPLGANFQEYIAIVRAQPIKQLYLQAKIIGYYQGLDLIGYNLGSNPFGGFDKRLSDVRVRVGDGDRATCIIGSFVASYELKQNLFIDASFTKRNYETLITPKNNTTFMSIGLRWNMARRELDF
jgi:hypothetical protein